MELVRIGLYDRRLISDVYNFLSSLQNEYSNFQDWFYKKVIPGLSNGERMIYALKDKGAIVATLILKDAEEKKICTLRVSEKYRRCGWATFLLKVAFRELRCAKPIITVSSYHIEEFAPLLQKNGFILYNGYLDYYKSGITEYAFNGPLNEEISQRVCA